MIKNFCHLCGSTNEKGKMNPWVCTGCGNVSYANSKPTAEVALFNSEGEILLAKRAINPNKGKYDLPGGFIEYNERVETAVRREIKEELDLVTSDYEELVFVQSWNADYEFSKEVITTINFVFASKLLTDNISSLDDVESVKFVKMDKLSEIEFSYPKYPEIILKAYKQLFP